MLHPMHAVKPMGRRLVAISCALAAIGSACAAPPAQASRVRASTARAPVTPSIAAKSDDPQQNLSPALRPITNPRALAALGEADRLASDGQYRAAILRYRDVLAAYGAHARVLESLANVYLKWESELVVDADLLVLDVETLPIVLDALEIDPQGPAAPRLSTAAGDIFSRNGQFAAAERLHRSAVAGGQGNAVYGLAQALHGQRRFAEAVSVYDAALREAPAFERLASDPQSRVFLREMDDWRRRSIEFDRQQALNQLPLRTAFWRPLGGALLPGPVRTSPPFTTIEQSGRELEQIRIEEDRRRKRDEEREQYYRRLQEEQQRRKQEGN
jgi:tetratricopeptide (TPR) repeat protein